MGDSDHMFLPMVSNLVKSQLNSKLEIIRNAGHCCNLDQAGRFNELCIRFIQTTSGNQKIRQLSTQAGMVK